MTSPASQVIQRVIAAVLGGYVLAAAVSACLSYAMPVSRVDATLTGMLASFLLYVAVVMWAFAVKSLTRLWWQLGGAAVVFGALAVLLSPQLVQP